MGNRVFHLRLTGALIVVSLLVASQAAVVAVALLVASQAASAVSPVDIGYGNSWPRSIVVDSLRSRAYVDGLSGFYPPSGYSFGVINITAMKFEKVLPLDVTPGEMALDPVTGRVYVAGGERIAVFEPQVDSFVRLMDLKVPISGIAFNILTGTLLVTSGNRLFSIDPISGLKLANVTVGYAAQGMAIDVAHALVYVANYLSNSISVVRVTDMRVVNTVQASVYPSAVAIRSSDHTVYATTGQNTVVVIDGSTKELVRTVTVGETGANGTFDIAVNEGTGHVFVATRPGTVVSELDQSGAVVSRFTLNSTLYEMTIDQRTGDLYITNYHQVTVIFPRRPGLSYGSLFAVAAAGVATAIILLILIRKPFQHRPPSAPSVGLD